MVCARETPPVTHQDRSDTVRAVRTLGLLTMVPLIVACKGGFQVVPDATEAPDAPPDAPPVLACKAMRFPVASTVAASAGVTQIQLVNQIAVTTTPRGYHVFIVDGNSTLRGYSYEFSGTELVETAHNVSIMSNVAGTISAVALDPATSDRAEALLAVPCTSTSTTLIPLDAQLGPVTSTGTTPGTIHDGWLAGYGSLVRTDASHVVFLAQQDGTSNLFARSVSRLGVDEDSGSPPQVSTGGNAPSGPMIMRAGTGYLVVWDAAGPTPNEVQATVLDQARKVVTPPTKISPDTSVTTADADLPTAAYSAASNVSLFAWVAKIGRDQVWFSLRDEQLRTMPQTVGTMPPEGNAPSIAAGDRDFLVVWTDAGGAQQLSAARIGTDGSYLRPGLSTTGGTAPAWDLVVRNGQPALVWFEDVSSGPYLWFDALCN